MLNIEITKGPRTTADSTAEGRMKVAANGKNKKKRKALKNAIIMVINKNKKKESKDAV